MRPFPRGEHAPPSLKAIPKPIRWVSRPLVTLSDLISGEYVDTIARVASIRAKEVVDELGVKTVLAGVLEDPTFRVPYVCHKTSLSLQRDLILKFASAYVHEFDDRSTLLVLTEHSRAEPLYGEEVLKYVWRPTIGQIRRPVWDVTLRALVASVFRSSGLVKRCNKCRAIVYDECPNGCDEGWEWDVRVSARIYDGTGSMNMVLGRYMACRFLERNLSEIFALAKVGRLRTSDVEGFDALTFTLDLPREIEVEEAMVEDPLLYRRHDRLVVPEGVCIYYVDDESLLPPGKRRTLRLDDESDFSIIRKMVEKALDIELRKVTAHAPTHGMHLLEDPIQLYSCEKARLYLGFSTSVKREGGEVALEVLPEARVGESVWDYVQWRRGRGASARAIERTLLKHRSSVAMAPSGHLGRIEGLLWRGAGEERVSEYDPRTFDQFWMDNYGIRVQPEEKPLLRVRLMMLDAVLTYPPSTVFFGRDVLYLSPGVARYVEVKRASLKWRVEAVVHKALKNLRIGGHQVVFREENEFVDVHRLLLYEIRQRLLGRTIRARGRVARLGDRLYFLPTRLLGVG